MVWTLCEVFSNRPGEREIMIQHVKYNETCSIEKTEVELRKILETINIAIETRIDPYPPEFVAIAVGHKTVAMCAKYNKYDTALSFAVEHYGANRTQNWHQLKKFVSYMVSELTIGRAKGQVFTASGRAGHLLVRNRLRIHRTRHHLRSE